MEAVYPKLLILPIITWSSIEASYNYSYRLFGFTMRFIWEGGDGVPEEGPDLWMVANLLFGVWLVDFGIDLKLDSRIGDTCLRFEVFSTQNKGGFYETFLMFTVFSILACTTKCCWFRGDTERISSLSADYREWENDVADIVIPLPLGGASRFLRLNQCWILSALCEQLG